MTLTRYWSQSNPPQWAPQAPNKIVLVPLRNVPRTLHFIRPRAEGQERGGVWGGGGGRPCQNGKAKPCHNPLHPPPSSPALHRTWPGLLILTIQPINSAGPPKTQSVPTTWRPPLFCTKIGPSIHKASAVPFPLQSVTAPRQLLQSYYNTSEFWNSSLQSGSRLVAHLRWPTGLGSREQRARRTSLQRSPRRFPAWPRMSKEPRTQLPD